MQSSENNENENEKKRRKKIDWEKIEMGMKQEIL